VLDLIRFAVDRRATTSLAMTHHQENTSLRGGRSPTRQSTAPGSHQSGEAALSTPPPRGGLFEVHPIHNVGVGLVADNKLFEQTTDSFDVVVVGGDAQGA
jgi:hypothetical protein